MIRARYQVRINQGPDHRVHNHIMDSVVHNVVEYKPQLPPDDEESDDKAPALPEPVPPAVQPGRAGPVVRFRTGGRQPRAIATAPQVLDTRRRQNMLTLNGCENYVLHIVRQCAEEIQRVQPGNENMLVASELLQNVAQTLTMNAAEHQLPNTLQRCSSFATLFQTPEAARIFNRKIIAVNPPGLRLRRAPAAGQKTPPEGLCGICPRQFATSGNLSNHLKQEIHQMVACLYVCPDCDMGLDSRWTLIDHVHVRHDRTRDEARQYLQERGWLTRLTRHEVGGGAQDEVEHEDDEPARQPKRRRVDRGGQEAGDRGAGGGGCGGVGPSGGGAGRSGSGGPSSGGAGGGSGMGMANGIKVEK